MVQNYAPRCPQCGTPIIPGERFCSNCGATNDPGFSKPTASAPTGERYGQIPDMLTNLPVPPPPPESLYSQPAPNTYYPPQAPQSFPQPQQSYQPNVAPPVYTQPQKDSSKGVLGQIGCGVLLVILLIVGVCGGLSYAAYRWIASASSNVTSTVTSNNTTNGTSNGNGNTPQAIPTVTAQINQTITYASVDLTILSIREASSFTDDTNTNTPVLVRVNLKEHNPTAGAIFLFYGDNFRLILPDGTSIAPGSEHDNGGLNQAVERTNWVDFPVSASIDISKLTLRLGAADQAQMDVPLTGNADLGKYQLKTISPNTPFQYAGLKWTLTTVTSSLSADGKQADTGMRYIVVTLKVDNPTQNSFYVFPNDNIRLQTGSTITPPTSNTLNISIAAGTTGTTGTVTFLMTQSSNSFTLVMLARSDTTPPASQVTTSFQI